MRAYWMLLLVSCGGTIQTNGDGGGPTTPDANSPANVCSSGTCASVQVMKTAYLGDLARGGAMTSTTAWKDFGEDIDGKITDTKSTDVCTRAPGSPTSVQVDGNRGIDNSFGANILPLLQSVAAIANPSLSFDTAIAAGTAHSLLFDVHVAQGGASLKLDVAAPLGKPAQFTPADIWSPSAFTTSSLGATLSDFQPTVAGRTLISGRSSQRLLLLVHFGSGVAFPIPLDRVQIRMDLAPNTLAGSNGVLSGVIPTETFIAAFQQVAGGVSKSLCGSAFDGIAQQIRQCQDILSDGTNRANVACDGISFGMGFEPAAVQSGTPVSETPVMQTCP